MPCVHPLPAVRPGKGRIRFDGLSLESWSDPDVVLNSSFHLLLPCGSCVGCQLSRARSWAIRCALELQRHAAACFVTLTFSDRYCPPSLRRSDVSLFHRRLRKLFDRDQARCGVPAGERVRLRHFSCGEYGEQGHRPHYHAIVFGTADERLVRQAWGKGFVTVEAVTPGRISYVAGYCAKKLGFFGEAGERVDYATGELYKYQPPFLQMSRRPGIAGDARVHWRSWRRSAIWQGVEVPVPRFLHSSYLEHASESELAELEREKRERSMWLTVRELRASEAIVRARMSHNQSRRKL